MKIAVNTRLLLKDKLEGIGWFTYETLKRITTNHPEHHFYFIFDRPFHPDFILVIILLRLSLDHLHGTRYYGIYILNTPLRKF